MFPLFSQCYFLTTKCCVYFVGKCLFYQGSDLGSYWVVLSQQGLENDRWEASSWVLQQPKEKRLVQAHIFFFFNGLEIEPRTWGVLRKLLPLSYNPNPFKIYFETDMLSCPQGVLN